VKAVNLIPSDGPRATRSATSLSVGPGYVLLGLLGIALVFVSVYVLTNNTISSRKAKLTTLQQQATQAEAQAARLANYTKFAQLAQARVTTIKQLASSRFDWHSALSDLSKVVPADTSLKSLLGTVAPGVSVSGAGGSIGGSGGSTGGLRGDISSPAFELSGCTKTQDDVARLMSRLRVMNGVTRVTLADSSKQDGVQAGVASSGSAQGCGANAPSFDLVVFFQALPGAALAAGGTPGAAPSPAPSSTTTTSSTTATTTAATPTATTPAATTTPVSTASPGGSK
jgi:Tfp pilus assembly protein PilN